MSNQQRRLIRLADNIEYEIEYDATRFGYKGKLHTMHVVEFTIVFTNGSFIFGSIPDIHPRLRNLIVNYLTSLHGLGGGIPLT